VAVRHHRFSESYASSASLCVADALVQSLSFFWRSRREKNDYSGFFGHDYCEYFLVRKPCKVYITVRVFFSSPLNGRVVALHDLLLSVHVHGTSYVPVCVYSRTFWAFALTQWHAYDNFSVLSLWILKEKLLLLCWICQIFFAIFDLLYFARYIYSVATRLRCRGKYNNIFAANVLLSSAVKEFVKSVNIFQSYA